MARNVPEYLRRSIRLAICTGIACTVGFALLQPLGGWHARWGSQTMMGTKWAAITCVVINHPVISKSGEAAVERVLGTFCGGVLGYLLCIFNDAQPFYEEPLITVFSVATVAFCSVLLGYKLQLDYAGRLFIMTFILVAMAAPTKTDAFITAVTRISGIVFGVIISTIMSVLVFPRSASHQATDNLKAGLTALAELNSIAWKKHGCGEDNVMEPLKYEPPRRRSTDAGDGDCDSFQLVVDPEDRSVHFDKSLDTCCDKMLSEVYKRMSKTQEFSDMSKSETYVVTVRGRWCFFPGFKCWPWRSALPIKEMHRVTESARKVARLLWCLHASLPDEDDIQALGQYWGAHEFLESLGSSLQVYLENVASCFPGLHELECDQLYTFIEGVETLISASHRASREGKILLQAPYSYHRKQSQQSFSDHSEEEDDDDDDDEFDEEGVTGVIDIAQQNGHPQNGHTAASNQDNARQEVANGQANHSILPSPFSSSNVAMEANGDGGAGESAKDQRAAKWRRSIARTLSSANSAPLNSLSAHNIAYIVKKGSVTRIGGPKPDNYQSQSQTVPSLGNALTGELLSRAESAVPDITPAASHRKMEKAESPVTEVLLEEASTKAVRMAAKGAGRTLKKAPSRRPRDSKQAYYSQVQWQATQFLLQRLTQEIATLNVSFIDLIVLLPPTRWESRRRRASTEAENGESSEPLLRV